MTFPVVVLKNMSPASQALNATSPVLLSMEIFSAAITSVRKISPVLPFEIKFLHEISVNLESPVLTLT